jgi:hypothetical protein
MSPGAFWGRPGGANPFINPAVGAPVHGSPGGFFGMHPVSPHVAGEEPAGYFPPVPFQSHPPPLEKDYDYFPPVSTAFGLESLSATSLANEVLRRGSTLQQFHGEEGFESSPSRSNSATGTESAVGGGSAGRRPSSSNGTSWDASDREGVQEKEEEPEGGMDGHPISRSQSMLASERRPSLEVASRSDSDPIQAHSRESEVRAGSEE